MKTNLPALLGQRPAGIIIKKAIGKLKLEPLKDTSDFLAKNLV